MKSNERNKENPLWLERKPSTGAATNKGETGRRIIRMGSPLVDDIVWTCDICLKAILKGDEIRPDRNSYNAYHKNCLIALQGKYND